MIDYYIVACAILHNIAIRQNDPEPERDPQYVVRDASPTVEPAQNNRPANVNRIDERRTVRDHLIANHFTNLINARTN